MIFQIQAGQPGIVPADPLFPHECLQQPLFGDPIEPSDELLAI